MHVTTAARLLFTKRQQRCAALLCGAALLAGCAAAPRSSEALVVERAARYLAARQTGDVDTVYSLLAPSQRAIHSKEQFVATYGARTALQGGDLYSVTCQGGEQCVLRRSFTYRFPFPQAGMDLPMSIYINETWAQEGGQWWALSE